MVRDRVGLLYSLVILTTPDVQVAEKAAGRCDGFTGFHVLGSMRHKVSVSQRRHGRQSFRSLPVQTMALRIDSTLRREKPGRIHVFTDFTTT